MILSADLIVEHQAEEQKLCAKMSKQHNAYSQALSCSKAAYQSKPCLWKPLP